MNQTNNCENREMTSPEHGEGEELPWQQWFRYVRALPTATPLFYIRKTNELLPI